MSSTTVNYVPVTVVRLRKGVRMNLLRILPLACLLAAGAAQAQSAGECPLLPGDSGSSRNALAGADFVFCKALRDSGEEVFSVMISADSPFDTMRSTRDDESVTDAPDQQWYRGECHQSPT